MNRRGFLTSLIGGVAATAAVRTWPFRVFSFPSDIAVTPLEIIPGFAPVYYKQSIAIEDIVIVPRFHAPRGRIDIINAKQWFKDGMPVLPWEYHEVDPDSPIWSGLARH